jgi:hypothetical protein
MAFHMKENFWLGLILGAVGAWLLAQWFAGSSASAGSTGGGTCSCASAGADGISGGSGACGVGAVSSSVPLMSVNYTAPFSPPTASLGSGLKTSNNVIIAKQYRVPLSSGA